MGRYMKYEIKGSYKFILGVLALVLILTTALYSYEFRGQPINSMTSNSAFVGIAILIILGAAFAAFLYIVDSFRKELYDDRGYLTFTLPLSGNQILGSKLIVAIMWFIILGVTFVLFNMFMVFRFIDVDINFKELISYVDFSGMLTAGIIMFLSGVVTLILIYFSMALSRVTFRNKKIGGLWFIVFLVLNALIGYATVKIISAFPYYLDLKAFKVVNYNDILIGANSLNGFFISFNEGSMAITTGGTTFINIASFVFMIIVGVVSFLSTGYLIENKIDL